MLHKKHKKTNDKLFATSNTLAIVSCDLRFSGVLLTALNGNLIQARFRGNVKQSLKKKENIIVPFKLENVSYHISKRNTFLYSS